jgi:thiol-disulfide isomerase/thioredoxin
VVHGTVLGHDGKPMKKAQVHLAAFADGKVVQVANAARNGEFSLSTDRTGLMELQFTGVDHVLHSAWILFDKPCTIHLDVRLTMNQYVTDPRTVTVIGDFNNFDPSSGRKLSKQRDGTYATEIETADSLFAYQFAGLEKSGRTVNGQDGGEYRYDNDGDYKSLVTPKDGKVRIVLDPKKLVRATSTVRVKFDETDRPRADLSEIISDVRDETSRFIRTVQHAQSGGKDPRDVARGYDWSRMNGRFERKLKTTTDPLVREALFAGYFALGGEKKDPALAAEAIEEVPATSPFWILSPPAIKAPFHYAQRDSEASAYVEKAIDGHPEASVRAYLLFDGLMMATYANQTERARKYYDRLLADHPGTRYAQMARERLSPDRAIAAGKPLPSFSIAALDDSSTVYSNETFKGRTFLIDFWAAWCTPCVMEMENLHNAYERFKARGLEVLSLSFDRKPEDIKTFRNNRWKMPWLHAYVEGGFNSKLAQQFEIMAIPKPILISGEGIVLAIGSDLRGENLEKTLANYLGE